MRGYSFGTNEIDTKIKSKSATSFKRRKESTEEDEQQEIEKQQKQKANVQNEKVQNQVIENIKEMQLNEENNFLSFVQINDIDINQYQNETQLFQDNLQGDFNHASYHQQLQENIKVKEKEYFQKLSLEFYNEQRIPHNEYLELKQILIKQKEAYEKQPCVNVNKLLSFEKKLTQLDRLWDEIKQDLQNNQLKQKKEDQIYQKQTNNKSSGFLPPHQNKNLDELENDINDNNRIEDDEDLQIQNDTQKENFNKDYNIQRNMSQQKQQIKDTNKNVQRVNYQFIKPAKKIGGIKTEHSPQNFRENPQTINDNSIQVSDIKQNKLNIIVDENLTSDREVKLKYPILSSAHSPKSRSNPQRLNNNDQQVQRMYAPFNISKSNQQINTHQNNSNQVNTFPRVQSSAIRAFSPAKITNNTKSVKTSENQIVLRQNSKEGNSKIKQNNHEQSQDVQINQDTINRKNIFVKKSNVDQNNINSSQKIKIVNNEINEINTSNKQNSPNRGFENENSPQRINFILGKPPSTQNNQNKNKIQNNSSPIKKEGHQFIKIANYQKKSTENVQKPQQIQAINGNKYVKTTVRIQSSKKRPNSPNSMQRSIKYDQHKNEIQQN